MKSCPFCGKEIDINDGDMLYPSGSVWRDDHGFRTYHPLKDRLKTDNYCYALHCEISAGGCGAEMHGDSKQEVIDKWERRV